MTALGATVTILARLTTRLGPGLLHEVRCEALGPLFVGDGLHSPGCRCGCGLGCSPERDWGLCIPAQRLGKRVEIVDAALVRFTVRDRHRHCLSTWYPVGGMRYLGGDVFELVGNFSFGGMDGSIAKAREWLDSRQQPDNGYRVYEWQRRTGNALLTGYPRNELLMPREPRMLAQAERVLLRHCGRAEA
jgi:hypothetical protein